MKKVWKTIGYVVLFLSVFAVGFFLRIIFFPRPILPISRAYSDVNSADDLVDTMFGHAKFVGRVDHGNDTAPLEYVYDGYRILTDSEGNKIISVTITGEKAEEISSDMGARLSDTELENKAIEEFNFYSGEEINDYSINIQWDEYAKITIDELDDLSRPTGRGGFFTYYPNGCLYGLSLHTVSVEE